MGELIQNWEVIEGKLGKIIFALAVTLATLIAGIFPLWDSISNIGGVLFGFLLGLTLCIHDVTNQNGQLQHFKPSQVRSAEKESA